MRHIFLLFGASRGIGAACARALYARGAQVCLAARDEKQLNVARAAAGPSASAYVTDITSASSVQETVEAVLEQHGKIDTVVNFAARTGPLNRPTWGVKPEDWEDLVSANLTGPMNIIRSTIPALQSNGQGALFFASSPFGDTPTPGMGGYCSTRAGLNMLVQQLATELEDSKMGAALIYPGITDTEGLSDFREARGGAAVGGQVATPAEMAKLFVWAAMQAPWHINGRILAWSDQNVRSEVEELR